MNRFLLIVLVVTLLTGCGPARIDSAKPTPEPQQPLATPLSNWTVRMQQSGGIMGMSQSIEVKSDGQMIVTDDRAQKTVKGTVPSKDLNSLIGLVNSARLTQPSRSLPNCADCFIYSVEIDTGSGKPFQAQVNDISLGQSDLQPLISYLRGLMNQALK